MEPLSKTRSNISLLTNYSSNDFFNISGYPLCQPKQNLKVNHLNNLNINGRHILANYNFEGQVNNIEMLQENNNFYLNRKNDHKYFNSNEQTLSRRVKCDKIFLTPQLFNAESIRNPFLKKHTIATTMNDKYTVIPICKPPLSPFTNASKRGQQNLIKMKKEECFKDNVNDPMNTLITTESDVDNYKSLNDLELDVEKDEDDDESDYKVEEMDILDDLDSEILNDDIEQDDNVSENYESPTEDMLEEVHRVFHSTSLNDSKTPFIDSIFPNIPPVIRFVREGESISQLPFHYQSKLKWKLSSLTPNVVKRAAKRSGFKLINKGSQWSGYFGKHIKATGFKCILEHQKFNHLPGSFQIGRKDRLWRNVSILASKNGKSKNFNFLPKTYCLPGDIKCLKQAWENEDSSKNAKWILKPPASARGIGVKVINNWNQIPRKRPAIVQNYISRPFLINGNKFDLRIYVAVTSCDPLRIYVHKNGLVRFASHKYSKSSKNISNRFIHLTNYSVNKKNENYTSNENHEKCQGHKWSLQTLWKHMEENLHIDWRPIWKRIKDCIVKTIISIEACINSNVKMYCVQKNSVYELFGFDVLLDSKLKPWVIEVNVSPSLHSNSPLDIEIKSSMVADLFNLVGFQLYQTSEESSTLSSSPSRRPSLSTSSIPNYVNQGNMDKSHIRSNQRQSSVLSLNKILSKQVSSGKTPSKSFETKDMQVEVEQKTQSNDSLRNSQSPDNSSTRSKFLKRKKTSSSYILNSNTTGQSIEEVTDLSLYQRRGYYSRAFTTNEKLKHKFYMQKSVCEDQCMLSTITDKLTIDDARILIESLDEFNRAGDFELVFPTSGEESDSYMTFIQSMSGSRYYNLLVHQFMKKYKPNDGETELTESIDKLVRPEGISLLKKYSQDLLTTDSVDLWSNPTLKDIGRIKSKFRSTSAGNISISK